MKNIGKWEHLLKRLPVTYTFLPVKGGINFEGSVLGKKEESSMAVFIKRYLECNPLQWLV
jgi:hypothetical protein